MADYAASLGVSDDVVDAVRENLLTARLTSQAVMDAPSYVDGHQLLAGKTVLVTAAAGTGIGFATAKRCVEEGARVVISDAHERRLGEAAAALGDAVVAVGRVRRH